MVLLSSYKTAIKPEHLKDCHTVRSIYAALRATQPETILPLWNN